MSEIPPIDPAPAPPAPAPAGLPWEAPSAGLGSLFPTAAQFITSPFQAFGKMSLTADLVRPIAYFVAFVLFGTLLGQIWTIVFWDQMTGFARSVLPEQFQGLLQRPSALTVGFSLVIAPLMALVILFVWTLLVHLALSLLGGAAGGFATTLRVVCYARTGDIAAVVPFLGGFIQFIWNRVLEIIGLTQAHRTEGWKAALGVVIPLAFCCFCLVGAAIAFGAAILRAIQQVQ